MGQVSSPSQDARVPRVAPEPLLPATRTRVVYIAGTSYCGSTLLALLLDCHPSLVSVGEACGMRPENDARTYPCSCGAPLAECPFFRSVREVAAQGGFEFAPVGWGLDHRYSRNRTLNRLAIGTARGPLSHGLVSLLRRALPGYDSRLGAIDKRNVAFMRAVLAVSGKPVFVDADKVPSRIRFLGRRDDLDFRVVHLTRDPRGYVNSARKNQDQPLERAAREWVTTNTGIRLEVERLPGSRRMVLRYEDLCENPAAAWRRLADFIDVPQAPFPQDYRQSPHHVVGNRMRLRAQPGSAIRLDDSWRTELSATDREAVARIAGSAAHGFGYDLSA